MTLLMCLAGFQRSEASGELSSCMGEMLLRNRKPLTLFGLPMKGEEQGASLGWSLWKSVERLITTLERAMPFDPAVSFLEIKNLPSTIQKCFLQGYSLNHYLKMENINHLNIQT